MEISLIDPAWNQKYTEQVEKNALSEEKAKELYNSRELEGERASYITSGTTAIIPIVGPLTKTRNFLYSIFAGNNTTYDSIVDGVQSAEGNEQIENIELEINSPGGNWLGLTEAVQEIAGATKPVTAKITGMATSAAYILASQADKIISTSEGNDVGGLGVQVRNIKWNDEKVTRSSNAPNKNPDPFTKNGERELIKQLDEVEAKAIKMVSEGRTAATGENITEATVKKDFGRGASMLADQALRRNMIDEIFQAPPRVSNSTPGAVTGRGKKKDRELNQEPGRGSGNEPNNKRKIMELNDLKTEYPQLCAQLIEEGRTLERDQVKGHVTMAENTGAVEFALSCLKDGKSLQSQEVIAGYMSAGMNKKDLQDREQDNPDGNADQSGSQELSEDEQEKELVEKALKASNKSVMVEA